MLIQLLILVVGFAVLIKSANIFVDGVSSVARNLNISRLVIGLTVVAFGTSAPELAISFKALLSGTGDVLLGNVIGSNIVNILLIIGISSIFGAIRVKSNTIKKELPLVFMTSLLLVILFSDNIFDKTQVNMISRSDGFVILLFFTIFIYYLFSIIRKKVELDNPDTEEDDPKYPMLKSIIVTILGLVIIVIASHYVVESASKIARFLGVTDRLISLTIIAIGTSLPELVTSIVASRKKEYDLLIGNIVGTNIFNIGIVIGLPVAMFGGVIGTGFSYLDLAMLLLSAAMLFFMAGNDKIITKKEGMIMLITVIAYYAYIIIS